MAERRRHAADLWNQMGRLADKYQDLTGCQGFPQEHRAEILYGALCRTPLREVSQQSSAATSLAAEDDACCDFLEQPMNGYLPLLDFLSERVLLRGGGLFTIPEDWWNWCRYLAATLLGLALLLLQAGIPTFLVWRHWPDESNYFRNPGGGGDNLSLQRPQCLFQEDEQFVSVFGGLVLVLTIYALRLYVDDEVLTAERSSLMPHDAFWLLVPSLVKAYCAVVLCIALPLLFWNEHLVVNVIFDVLGLTLLLRLDQAVAVLGCHGGLQEWEFRRLASWTNLYLAMCPARLQDVVNPKAECLEDLWHLEFDGDGRLQDVHYVLSLGAIGPPVCRTRLMWAEPDDPNNGHAGEEFLYYQVDGSGRSTLPSSGAVWSRRAWVLASLLLVIMQFLVPLAYIILNDSPCWEDAFSIEPGSDGAVAPRGYPLVTPAASPSEINSPMAATLLRGRSGHMIHRWF
eukprot:TRINITY_DN30503_c0_g1_i1.p1 TRINITY_DN30503_c0_g1~~TRINITY_DN30503_c0_g1_i1.p1  ORF type:complete len:521 (-),score=61.45 TRINITY_DN30503_c0_g1_i1:44-1414(-)